MHKDKIEEIQKEIKDKNRANSWMFIKEMCNCINNNFNDSQYLPFIYILFVALVILPMLGPIANLFLIEDPDIASINLIGIIFYIFVISGTFGRCTCCCFYRPSNWILMMLIFDLATFVVNIIVIVMVSSLKEFDNKPFVIIISAFNNLIDIYIIIPSHCKAFKAMQDIYRRSREYEINIIKKCVMELVGEIKIKNNNI